MHSGIVILMGVGRVDVALAQAPSREVTVKWLEATMSSLARVEWATRRNMEGERSDSVRVTGCVLNFTRTTTMNERVNPVYRVALDLTKLDFGTTSVGISENLGVRDPYPVVELVSRPGEKAYVTEQWSSPKADMPVASEAAGKRILSALRRLAEICKNPTAQAQPF